MKFISLISILLVFSLQVSAGEFYSNRCSVGIFNMLYRLESKQKAALEMVEFRFTKPNSPILANQKLVMPPAPFMKNIKNFYRVPSIAKKGRALFSKSIRNGVIADKDFPLYLEPNTYYTYVLQDDKITMAKTRPGVMRNYGSKHSLLTDQTKDVRMAGEAWVDDQGVFHFDSNSGTFKPSAENVANVERFFKEHLGMEKVEGHVYVHPGPAAVTK